MKVAAGMSWTDTCARRFLTTGSRQQVTKSPLLASRRARLQLRAYSTVKHEIPGLHTANHRSSARLPYLGALNSQLVLSGILGSLRGGVSSLQTGLKAGLAGSVAPQQRAHDSPQ